MKTYTVGPDEETPHIKDEERFSWCVVNYTVGDYSGNGEAVLLHTKDQTLWIKNLGHCSCYGPWDGGDAEWTKVSIEDWLKDTSVTGALTKPVEAKVNHLLRGDPQ